MYIYFVQVHNFPGEGGGGEHISPGPHLWLHLWLIKGKIEMRSWARITMKIDRITKMTCLDWIGVYYFIIFFPI
jgi:hypothetical protein